MTEERWLDANGSQVKLVQIGYDAVGNRTSINDGSTAYRWTHDVLNRPFTENNTGSTNLPALTLSWQYDDNGNRTAVFDNDGVRVDSAYSNRDELLSKVWSGGPIDDLRVSYQYNDRGERIRTDRFSEAAGTNRVGSSLFTFDDSGRETGVTHRNAIDAVLADFDYEYDFANQLTQEVNRGEQIDYAYDLIGQLTSANRSTYTDEFYSFNANGSRLTSHRQSGTSTIGPNNQLLSDGEFTYQYDDEGNLLRRINSATGQTTDYVYDHRNRLLRVIEKNSVGTILEESSYRYDVLGRRVEKIENGQVTKTLYDDDNAWLDADAANNIETWYLFGDAQYDENIARYNVTDGAAWYLADKLGSITTVVNMQHTFVATAYFDSFGNQIASTNAPYLDRFAFAAREVDTVSGLYYNRTRYFNPSTGVFAQQDPLRFRAGDSNLYRYVSNSPVNMRDPSGELSLAGYNVANSRILLLGLNAAAGGMGCFIGSSIHRGKTTYTRSGVNIVVRGGLYQFVAYVVKTKLIQPELLATAARTPLVLAGGISSSFVIGIIVCSA